MVHQIFKSKLLPYPGSMEDAKKAFSSLVTHYIVELTHWHKHDAKCAVEKPLAPHPKWQDTANVQDAAQRSMIYQQQCVEWQKIRMARHEPYPKPVVQADIEASVSQTTAADGSVTFSADFEIVNDDPTNDDLLSAAKALLLERVIAAEAKATDAILPPAGKRRLQTIEEASIRDDDLLILQEIKKDLTPEEIQVTNFAPQIEAKRDPAKTAKLQEAQRQRDAVERINHIAAQAMSDIEDLTAETIDGYTIPSFS